MNKIDSRFLDFPIAVRGIWNDPPISIGYGDQVIVGEEPTGDFDIEGAYSNYIAKLDHDDRNNAVWKFMPPVKYQQVFDISTGNFLQYNGLQWQVVTPSYNKRFVNNITEIILASDTAPENPTLGTLYFDTTTNTIRNYQSDGWRTGGVQIEEYYLVYDGSQFYHYCDYNTFVVQIPLRDELYVCQYGQIHKDNHGNITITHDPISDNGSIYMCKNGSLYCVWSSGTSASTSGGKEFYTETHTLTAEEVTNKAFTLAYSVESGEETNILCSISGIIQPANVAFGVSGDTLSWDNKTLDGSLNAGDVFVVHYVKAAE